MVYIFSEKSDAITDLVAEWLVEKKSIFKRFNDDDFVKNSYQLSQKDVKKVWQRRGTFNVIPNAIYTNYPNRIPITNYLHKETKELSMFLEYSLKRKLKENYIGSFQKEVYSNNKLINLEIAKSVGFKVPITLVTTNKEELLDFFNKHKIIISKDLRSPVFIKTKNKSIVSKGVQLVTEKMISKLESVFAPIFAQKYIEKKYEIRVFIFSKKLYAMAIFSQKDKQTQIDYRNYNNQKPNRCVPVLLPEKIEKKVWRFMEEAAMNTGSVDIIVTPTNEYIFLEINPMGQFHWLSGNCNYHIEKDIAEFLSNE